MLNRYIKISIIVFCVSIVALFVFPQIDPNSCRAVIEDYREHLEKDYCFDKVLDGRYESVEMCVNSEMGLYDPVACM